MRRIISFVLIVTFSLLMGIILTIPALARDAVQDSYCLQGRQWGYPGNCQFSSYQQCMATASGTDAYCGVNPRRAYGVQRRRGGDRSRY
jgi:hypothetical protein